MTRRYAPPMRLAITALALFLAGCAAGGAATSEPEAAADAGLSLDLFPFETSSTAFVDVKDSSPRTLRVEPSPDGESARIALDVGAGPPREMRVTRRGDSLFFSGGVELGAELLRAGARPGDAWESDGRRVTFDGWERVRLPAATYDAARVSARRGPAGLEQVETWWFAKGVGLVRLKSDHGTLFVDELVRSSP